MATKELKVLIGIPGSGKSTWAAQETKYLEMDKMRVASISRDFIRFSLLEKDEDYFNKEKEVFKEFIRQINEALELGFDYVIVDATHISAKSRAKLLRGLRPDPSTQLSFEIFCTPLQTCIERNNLREGRERVPESAIRNMSKNFTTPDLKELPEDLYGFRDVVYHYHIQW